MESASSRRFADRLAVAVDRSDSLLCVGLDPDPRRIPASFGSGAGAVVAFNRAIIEATADLVCAYKPNLGFYLAYGAEGAAALAETRRLIPSDIPVILDAKVGDVGVTSAAYARGYFDEWDFDAVTVHPYIGEDGLEPFLRHAERGILVLAKTSNPGSGDLQDIAVAESSGEPLYLRVAERVNRWQAVYGNCGLVVGATYPAQLAQVRERCPGLPILVPGVGAQGGELAATLRAGRAWESGLIINASRSIIYAGEQAGSDADFPAAARSAAENLRDTINRILSTGSPRGAGLPPVPPALH